MSYAAFVALFPDDAACLGWLKERLYSDGTVCPGCRKASKFHPIRGRSAYSCQFCGTHVYPTAGTVFHKSRTGLQLWFWAIFLIASTRGRITTRELERELRVTYKTAQRMLTQLRAALGLNEAGAEAEPKQVPLPAPAASPRAWHGVRRRG
jgi:transposase